MRGQARDLSLPFPLIPLPRTSPRRGEETRGTRSVRQQCPKAAQSSLAPDLISP